MQFGLVVKQKAGENQWKVEQINLDDLLTTYVNKVADGDTYFTPLVETPEGGETLALYFDVDKASLSRKAYKQLEIVAKMLTASSEKKLTLSGHTDDSGPDDYNDSLSFRRAESVRDYLIERGVEESQVEILAYGETKPRRKNDTEQGRQANRRTEIYLDF